jgi:hypothetical protein
VEEVVDRAGESPDQQAAADEASENGDPHHEVKHGDTLATLIDGRELKSCSQIAYRAIDDCLSMPSTGNAPM